VGEGSIGADPTREAKEAQTPATGAHMPTVTVDRALLLRLQAAFANHEEGTDRAAGSANSELHAAVKELLDAVALQETIYESH